MCSPNLTLLFSAHFSTGVLKEQFHLSSWASVSWKSQHCCYGESHMIGNLFRIQTSNKPTNIRSTTWNKLLYESGNRVSFLSLALGNRMYDFTELNCGKQNQRLLRFLTIFKECVWSIYTLGSSHHTFRHMQGANLSTPYYAVSLTIYLHT